VARNNLCPFSIYGVDRFRRSGFRAPNPAEIRSTGSAPDWNDGSPEWLAAREVTSVAATAMRELADRRAGRTP